MGELPNLLRKGWSRSHVRTFAGSAFNCGRLWNVKLMLMGQGHLQCYTPAQGMFPCAPRVARSLRGTASGLT